jgi:hypothetical protein
MTHDSNGVAQPARPVHQIMIMLDENTDQLGWQANVPNKAILLGMLRMAEHAIMNPQPPKPGAIVPVPPGVRLR